MEQHQGIGRIPSLHGRERRASGSGMRLLAALLPLSLVFPATAACSQGQEQAQNQAPAEATGQVQAQTGAPAQTQAAEGPWRGIDVPRYPKGTDFRIEADDDEYEIRFRSADAVQAVFDHYRGYLEGQGFRVTRSSSSQRAVAVDSTGRQGSAATESKRDADMVRGQGGPSDSVELDVTRRGEDYKVEIEFDD